MDTTYVEEELDVKQEMEIKEEGITEKIEQMIQTNKRKSTEIKSEESKKQKIEDYCIMCQEFGHVIASDCVTCFNCGIKGHARRDCPSNHHVTIQPNGDRRVGSQLEAKGSIVEGRYDYPNPSENPQLSKADRDLQLQFNSIDRDEILRECTQNLVSPSDLARKLNCNPDTIRTWFRNRVIKAERTLKLPKVDKRYKRPKRPKTAFYFFMNEEGRERATSENPTATKKEIGRITGVMWSKLKDKTKWFEKAAVIREKYAQEFDKWIQSIPPEYITSTTKPTNASLSTDTPGEGDDKTKETVITPGEGDDKTKETVITPGEGDGKTKETVILNDNVLDKFLCVLCNKSFKKQLSLDQHNAALHNGNGKESKLKKFVRLEDQTLFKFKCLPCNRFFKKQGHLDQHNADAHSHNYGKGQGYKSQEFIEESDSSDDGAK